MTRDELEQIAHAWRTRIVMRDVLLVAAVICAVAAGAAILFRPTPVIIAAVAAFAVALVLRLSRSQPWKLDAAHLARHLDRAFPQLEESSALWLRADDSLTFVERLQRSRVDTAARQLNAGAGHSFAAAPPDFIRRSLMWFLAAAALLVAVGVWRLLEPPAREAPGDTATSASGDTAPAETRPSPPEWPRVTEATIVVAPPAYTGRPERRVDGLSAEVEEGALVTWAVRLNKEIAEVRLRFGAGDRDLLPLRGEGDGTWRVARHVTDTVLYGLAGTMQDGVAWRADDLHSISVIKDRAPVLKIVEPAAPRTTIAAETPNPQVAVEVLATDDYAIAGAHLIATVAKGTGEAVKFREQQIAFDRIEPTADVPNGVRLVKTFDLLALGLEPGDELYFHVEATDNREPSSNRARSETRFIVLKGPDQAMTTPGAGVSGINLVPEYFRSQRQIIIDTEKLIVDQPTLSAAEFQNRANNLAIDQQLLRQRYGAFLGEEADHADETPEAHAAHEQEEHSPDDGHDHSHDAPAAAPTTHAEVAAQFGHQHDSQDEATLFDRETKGTMREALAAMWEAERFLRVGQAREALAPENRALEIIKALQQADRSYVKRVGFEAAPIDFAARRLRGDVDAVPARLFEARQTGEADPVETDIRELLRLAPWRNHDAAPSDAAHDELLRRIEPVLIDAASAKPDVVSLGAIEELRRVARGERLPNDKPSELEAGLLRMLPPAERRPRREAESSSSLAEAYYRNLESGR